MTDEQSDQQRHSFHWPPTAEELDSIQVIEVHHDEAPAPSPAWWQRSLGESVMAQAGLLAASLAAIGIAVTSLLAPAQPVPHQPRTIMRVVQKPALLRAVAVGPAAVPLVASITPSRVPDIYAPPVVEALPAAPLPRVTVERPEPVHRHLVRRSEAASDPVSKFAVHTGKSVWGAMRAVGRSFRRDSAEQRWTSRSMARAGGGRRTARAVDLAAENVPSDR